MPRRPVSDDVQLSADTIGDLDNGIARAMIDAEITKAVQDLRDRGEEDGKPRKVIISLEMALKNGLVIVDVASEAKLPPRRSNSTVNKYRFVKQDQAELFFQPHNAENPEQPVLDDGEISG